MRGLLLVACVLAMGGTAKAQDGARDLIDMYQRGANAAYAKMTPEERATALANYLAQVEAKKQVEKDAHTRLSKRAAHSTKARVLSRRTNRATMAAKKAARVPEAAPKKVQPPQQPPLSGVKPSAR